MQNKQKPFQVVGIIEHSHVTGVKYGLVNVDKSISQILPSIPRKQPKYIAAQELNRMKKILLNKIRAENTKNK